MLALALAAALLAPAQPPGNAVRYLKPGSGLPTRDGDLVTIHFTARAADGRILADSERRGLPYTFQLGKDAVMPVWPRLVRGMRVGAERRIIASPWLLAGVEGNPPVLPPNTGAEVTVRLVRIERPAAAPKG